MEIKATKHITGKLAGTTVYSAGEWAISVRPPSLTRDWEVQCQSPEGSPDDHLLDELVAAIIKDQQPCK